MTPERKTYTDFMAHWHSRYVRTMRNGCRVYTERTERGKRLVMLHWMKRYPYLFTKEALSRERRKQ